MDAKAHRKFQNEEEERADNLPSPNLKKRSNIELSRIKTLAQSRLGHPADKPSCDWIQYYGLSAVRCFEMGENPTLALMALMPFKLGEFSLGQEIYQLLFSPPAIEKKPTQSDKELVNQSKQALVKAELTAFSNRLDKILISIRKFHSDPTNDPYLIQTAMGLQMFMVAARMKASSVDQNYEATFGRLLRRKLLEFHLNRINNKQYQNSIIYPAEKFLDSQTVQTELAYTLTPYAVVTKRTTTVDTGQKTEHLLTAPSMPDEFPRLNAFFSAFELAERNQFDEALGTIETILKEAEPGRVGKLISGYVDGYNYSLKAGLASNDFSLILNYLSKEDTSPQKQEFALVVLSKALEKTPGSEIDNLFHLDRGKQFLNTLLTLKPKSPHATLLLAELFETLVNKAPRMSQQPREMGEQPKTNPSLLALYLNTQEPTSLSNKTPAFIAAGVFILLGAVTLILAITTFPLLPLYIVGGVFAAVGISAGVSGLAMSGPIKEKTPQNHPMIQINLATWLTAYGYGVISPKKLLQLFENSPELVHTIDVEGDFEILKPLVQGETWDNIMPQLQKSFGVDTPKIVGLLAEDEDIFKNLVTHINQLKTLSDWIRLSWLVPTKKSALKKKMSELILNQDDHYFNSLIDNGCAPVIHIGIPSHREIGETTGRVQTRSTENPDPYEMLLTIFEGDKTMERLIQLKKAAAQAAAQQSVFGEVPPGSTIAKKLKAASNVDDEQTDTTPKPGD